MASVLLSYEQWDAKFGKVSEPFPEVFRDESLADVILLVGSNKTRVPAHKFVLSACSWEFYNVFHLLKLDEEELTVDEVSLQIFLHFLKFCYKAELNLNLSLKEVLALLQIAHRFRVRQLIRQCENRLGGKLNRETCLEIFIGLEEKYLEKSSNLQRDLHQIIAKNIIFISNSTNETEFAQISQRKLREIAKLDDLDCDEMQLFDILMRWAKRKCEKENIPSTPKNLRKCLGDVFYEIHFPIMKLAWIIEILTDYPDLLTGRECSNILHFIKHKKICPGFKNNARKFGPEPIRNIKGLKDFGETRIMCLGNKPQMPEKFSKNLSVGFQCDTSRTIIGFGFYTKANERPDSVSCSLWKMGTWEKEDVLNYKHIRRWPICWEYEYYQYYFHEEVPLFAKEKCMLFCNFSERIPILQTFNEIYKNDNIPFYDEEYGIHTKTVRESSSEIIPTLIFK
ncbi:BTB/POZ domain-containing protein 6-like [Lutzomyia longipalpis]|uniref:BTB/POZ domain-containing protein 6-like n=1 Tax=Lutzomyia longipalpis TaxID=7200 RepID=UPI002483F6C8|nr:BTB/POZ domain-containing protein 6-like [Lutzomyia longipalpis]XP_055689587.1 BTB/POZ domain-containing protein 6-like [Lutzomyia longipalpis]